MIGRNQTKCKTLGLHPCLTLPTTVHGLPLAVLHCAFGTPPRQADGKSGRWTSGYRDTPQEERELTGRTRVFGVMVMSRKADSFALSDGQRRQGRVETLVRAKRDRKLARQGGQAVRSDGGHPD